MIEKYKAVVFDWDGTLVDSVEWVLGAHNHVRTNMGMIPWTREDLFGCSSRSSRETYPEVYGDRSGEALEMLYEYTSTKHLESAIPFTGAEQVLEVITEKSIKMGVVSNKRHEQLNETIDHLGWRKYFVSSIGAGHAPNDKPAPYSLLMAIDEMGMDYAPVDVLYVGDTETDLLCAQNAGCPAIFIQSHEPRPDLIEKYDPVCSYHDIQAFLDDLMSPVAVNKAC